MSKVLIDRELLADLICGDQDERINAERSLYATLANAGSAADCGLEVVAWQLGCQTLGGDIGYILSWSQSGAGVCTRLHGEEYERALVLKSDADALQSELNDCRETICRLLSELDAVPKIPSVSAMAKALSDKHADEAGVNRADTWKQYSHEYIEDVEYMLAYAPHVSFTDEGKA